MSRKTLTPVNIPAYGSNPNFPNPVVGDTYYNTVTLGMFVYNGTDWVPVSSGTTGGASPINPFSFWVGSN